MEPVLTSSAVTYCTPGLKFTLYKFKVGNLGKLTTVGTVLTNLPLCVFQTRLVHFVIFLSSMFFGLTNVHAMKLKTPPEFTVITTI